jgi:benzoylformate decarboxylase
MADSADWLIAALAAEGVELVFGNPGSTELPLVDAFGRQDRVAYVLGLHEMSVMGMADGYAQSTGRLAVVNVHVQPGIANALAGLINAARARVPMLVTVGQQVTGMLDEQPFLGGDVLSPAAPFAKGLWEPRRVADLPGVLERAIRLARTPPCGPVVVSLPMDVLVSDAPAAAPSPAGRGHAPVPELPELAALEVRLRQAEAPVLLVGDGVAHAGVAGQVTALAERLGAPMLAEPWASRVAVHANQPLWAGSLPTFGAQIRERLAPHDLALAIGMPTFRLFGASPGPTLDVATELVVLDEGQPELSAGVDPVQAIQADLVLALDALLAALGPRDARAAARRQAVVASCAAARRAARRAVPGGGVGITPARFARGVAGVVGPNDIVVDESLTAGRALRAVLGARAPGSWYAHRGSALGWGLPAAVGVAIAHPERRVICTHGDGSLLFGIHALWTAARLGLRLAVIVADNSGYEILRAGMEGLTGHPQGNWPGLAITDPGLDLVQIARGFGASAAAVDDPDALRPALGDLMTRSTRGPAVLVVRISGTTPAIGYPIAPQPADGPGGVRP